MRSAGSRVRPDREPAAIGRRQWQPQPAAERPAAWGRAPSNGKLDLRVVGQIPTSGFPVRCSAGYCVRDIDDCVAAGTVTAEQLRRIVPALPRPAQVLGSLVGLYSLTGLCGQAISFRIALLAESAMPAVRSPAQQVASSAVPGSTRTSTARFTPCASCVPAPTSGWTNCRTARANPRNSGREQNCTNELSPCTFEPEVREPHTEHSQTNSPRARPSPSSPRRRGRRGWSRR